MKREDELDALGRARLERDRVRRGLGWDGQELPHGLRAGAERPSYFWDTGKGLEVEMVFVPATSTTRAFYIGRYPTTWREFRVFCADSGHPVPPDPHWGAFDDHPVVNVTWGDAAAFCAWAGLRLPSQLEWRSAAFGEDGRTRPWGTGERTPERCVLEDHPRYGEVSTAPVSACASGAAACGALHMLGNVWQWTLDAGSVRFTRARCGGSWETPLDQALAAQSSSDRLRADDTGFRPLRPT